MKDFIPRQRIERRAIEHWHREALRPDFDIDRLVDRLDLAVLWEPISRVNGQAVAAELVPEMRLIRLNEDLRDRLDANRGFYRFTLAHEIGHWEFHSERAQQDGEVLFEAADPLVCRRLVFGRDDPPADFLTAAEARREHQANLFATYLLAPSDVFLTAFRTIGCNGWSATYHLADRLGLSAQATLIRLTDEGLGYRDDGGTPRSGRRPPPGQASFGL